MTDDEQATVPIPKVPLVDYLVNLAREVAPVEEHLSPPERGVESDVEWSWSDVDWDVESRPEDGELLVYGFTEGEYQVQTARAVTNAPPSKCHPAEYETRTMPVGVEIHCQIGDGPDLELGGLHVEVGVA